MLINLYPLSLNIWTTSDLT